MKGDIKEILLNLNLNLATASTTEDEKKLLKDAHQKIHANFDKCGHDVGSLVSKTFRGGMWAGLSGKPVVAVIGALTELAIEFETQVDNIQECVKKAEEEYKKEEKEQREKEEKEEQEKQAKRYKESAKRIRDTGLYQGRDIPPEHSDDGAHDTPSDNTGGRGTTYGKNTAFAEHSNHEAHDSPSC